MCLRPCRGGQIVQDRPRVHVEHAKLSGLIRGNEAGVRREAGGHRLPAYRPAVGAAEAADSRGRADRISLTRPPRIHRAARGNSVEWARGPWNREGRHPYDSAPPPHPRTRRALDWLTDYRAAGRKRPESVLVRAGASP